MKKSKFPLHWQIIVALLIAVIVTASIKYSNSADSDATLKLLSVCDYIATLFMNALKMIVVPIIVSSVLCGVLKMKTNNGDFGRLALKTLSFYVLSTLLAVMLGWFLVTTFKPGIVDQPTAEAILGQSSPPTTFLENIDDPNTDDIVKVFHRMIPPNLFKVTADNSKLISLITASLLIGFFLNRLPHKLHQLQLDFWQGIQQAFIMLTHFIIKFAPIGVFALVTPVFLRTGTDLIAPLTKFFLIVVLALGTHFLITMPLLLRILAGINPIQHFKAMSKALLTAFSTASSAATIPVTMDCIENKAGVSNRTASFVIPLGATVNMDGTALYECIVVIFIAQFYSVIAGFQMDFAMHFTIILLSLLTSIGVAGVPAASLVAITAILSAVGLPIEAIGLVIAIDRILDMCRTAVNVFGDSVGAAIIAKSEGEKNLYRA